VKSKPTQLVSKCLENSFPEQGYQPDLSDLLSQCELNYRLLMLLWPDFSTFTQQNSGNVKAIHQKCFEYDMITVLLDVIDVAKYTTTMNMTIKNMNIESPAVKLSHGMKLIVRIYHDAKMLEVMEGPGPSALKAIYSRQANKPIDEKRQINRFVGESMQACLREKQAKG
jgi:uncharacterized protein YqiB (DUF1249 family)